MSRRSSLVLDGPQVFSWRFERTPSGGYKAICENFPGIFGEGPDEQTALLTGQTKVREAALKGELSE